ncbi:hypothetical protein OC846_005813 [Tilletia horrida]|uniref:Arrestin-like N-terminal domain-containing protein n=1 Tax=Tilletia horrida TaxID=155126 RepID=A0AAN6JPJ9_9BASI|nr:hypothetical protein OC845_005907 [Tilletia horrida]KAK0545075.1 hypothetical protein OC846_005813 [Tilletia horrida]KAK0561165.1 hypothetical protein OC861_005949 [Tilletia horrida]
MKLRLTTDNADLFLRPSAEGEVVLLTLHVHVDSGDKPPARIDKLVVSISAQETMAFPSGRYERNMLYDWRQEVKEAAGLALQPNTLYTWQTVFRVPNTTEEYHRSMYGRRYAKAVMKLTAPGFMRQKTWTEEKNLFLVHAPASEDDYAFSRSETGIAEGLGVVTTKTSSAHLNVGGYLHLWLDIPAAAPEISITSFEAAILQTITLRSRTEPALEEVCPVQRHKFLSVPGSEIKQGHWIARLPNDSQMRSSSWHLLGRGIFVTHNLELVIKYNLGPPSEEGAGGARLFRQRWPVSLPSCALRYHSLRLPLYQVNDATPVPQKNRDEIETENEHEDRGHCVCGQPLEVLLKIESELAAVPQERDLQDAPLVVMDEARHKFESGTRTPKSPG